MFDLKIALLAFPMLLDLGGLEALALDEKVRVLASQEEVTPISETLLGLRSTVGDIVRRHSILRYNLGGGCVSRKGTQCGVVRFSAREHPHVGSRLYRA
jgi:hypothetical protein